jgi:hypothetical protein
VSDDGSCRECRNLDGCQIRRALIAHLEIAPGLDFNCANFDRRLDEVWFHDYMVPCLFRSTPDGNTYAEFHRGLDDHGKSCGMYFQVPGNVMDMIAKSWLELRQMRGMVRA